MEKDIILELLESADWNDIILKLTNYAIWRAKRYTWRSGSHEHLPGGKTPADVALEAITKVWAGTRDWDPDKYPNLLRHLMWIVDSDMEHLLSSMEHHSTTRMLEAKDTEKNDAEYIDIPINLTLPDDEVVRSSTPEGKLIACEEAVLEEEMKDKLYKMVKGDEDLELLLLCFEDGIDKPEAIASQTGWDVSKVYNLKRKLLRKAAKVDHSS